MKKIFVIIGIAAIILLSACSNSEETLVISGKPWTEQFILPQILGQYIEDRTDYRGVQRRTWRSGDYDSST